MKTANDVIKELKKLGSPERAKASLWFFKTGKGDYGHGDVFFGVSTPLQRKIAKRSEALPLNELAKLLKNRVHECRFTALVIMVRRFERGDLKEKERVAKFYIAHRKHVNNWDLVDSSASYILGRHLLDKERSILFRFARSKDLWERRIAVISTAAFIREGDLSDTFRISEMLLKDKHDLIHKAAGWMLREAGNRSRQAEEAFLKKYAPVMPRTMLRYAIEKFPEKKRKSYLSMRIK